MVTGSLWLALAGCVFPLDTPAEKPVAQFDEDGDGYPTASDCDDTDPTRWASGEWYVDADGDDAGWGEALDCVGDPASGQAWATIGGDCNDTDPTRWASGEWYVDADGDDVGSGEALDCVGDPAAGQAWATIGGDCDDTNPDVWRPVDGYRDGDGDGYGDEAVTCLGEESAEGDGLVDAAGDCDDGGAETNPAAAEDCYTGNLNCTSDDEPYCRLEGDWDFTDGAELPLPMPGPLVNVDGSKWMFIGDVCDPDVRPECLTDGGLRAQLIRPGGTGAWEARASFTAANDLAYMGLLPWYVDDLDGDGTRDVFLALASHQNARSAVWWFDDGLGAYVDDFMLDETAAWQRRGTGSPFPALGTSFASGELVPEGGLELAIGANSPETVQGRVELWNRWSTTPTLASTIEGPEGFTFGRDLVVADVNGDAKADLATTGSDVDSNLACLYIFHGPITKNLKSSDADARRCVTTAEPNAAPQVELAGDVDASGIAWLWFSIQGDDGGGLLYAIPGDADGVELASGSYKRVVASSPPADAYDPFVHFGESLALVGDQTGDGIADVVVGSPSYSGSEVRAWLIDAGTVFHGDGVDGSFPIQSPGVLRATFEGGPGDIFGLRIVHLGDYDDDGGDDFAMSGRWNARWFRGGSYSLP